MATSEVESSNGIRSFSYTDMSHPVELFYRGSIPWNDAVRETAFRITDVFEGGQPDSIQTSDSGIVSFGRHQATLASGALEAVLTRYRESSSAPQAAALAPFMNAVTAKDPALREDQIFLKALTATANDPHMQTAQGEVFSRKYWNPAVNVAQEIGIASPLGFAIYYDTNIQGGMRAISAKTVASFAARRRSPDEREFLQEFLKNRERYLESSAEAKRAAGDFASARAIRASISARIIPLRELVDANHLSLEGTFALGSRSVMGIQYR